MGPIQPRFSLPPQTGNTPTTLQGAIPTAATGGVRGVPMSTTPVEMPMQMTPDIPVMRPEALSYRTPEEVCVNCEYRDPERMCSVLKMEVEDMAGCNAFEVGA